MQSNLKDWLVEKAQEVLPWIGIVSMILLAGRIRD